MSSSGSGSSCPTNEALIEKRVDEKYNSSIIRISLIILFVGLGIGIALTYYLMGKNPRAARFMKERGLAFIESGPQKTVQYGPTFLLLAIAFCFLVGIVYVVEKQVKDKSKEDAKVGIQTAVGLAWGLFAITAILVPFALHYAQVPLDSYYYFFAAAFVFYFTCIVVIIVFHNKLSSVDPTSETFDVTDTHNVQNGLIAGLIAYGIGAFLML